MYKEVCSLLDSLLPSSCEQLMKKDGNVLKKNIAIRFNGEEGVVRKDSIITLQ